MLDECVRVLGKNGTPEEIVTKTLELNDIKMTSQLRQLESLKASLSAADEQVTILHNTCWNNFSQKSTLKLFWHNLHQN